ATSLVSSTSASSPTPPRPSSVGTAARTRSFSRSTLTASTLSIAARRHAMLGLAGTTAPVVAGATRLAGAGVRDMALATAEAIRDRIYNLIEGLTPTTDATKFRRYRNEWGADFIAAAEANP